MTKKCKSFIFIINGSNGVGKDTFIDKLRDELRDYEYLNISSIDVVKNMLRKNEIWDGQKDEKGRQLLAEVKAAINKYSDFINTDIVMRVGRWRPRTMMNSIAFIHVREPEQIEILSHRLESAFGEFSMVGTILIKRSSAEATANNDADMNVENYKYDIVLEDKNDEFKSAVNNLTGLIRMINPTSIPHEEKEPKPFELKNDVVKRHVDLTVPETDTKVVDVCDLMRPEDKAEMDKLRENTDVLIPVDADGNPLI